MPEPKLLIYSPQNFRCTCLYSLFNNGSGIDLVSNKEHFFQKIANNDPDLAIYCVCSASLEKAEEAAGLQALIGPLPLLVCSKKLPLDFVNAAGEWHIRSFLCCQWRKSKIEETVLKTISCNGIKKYIERTFNLNTGNSPYINKIIATIIFSFPIRPSEVHIASKLGISISWLQKLFRRTLKLGYHRFLRRIWTTQAMFLMKYSKMDNTEIAFYLNYTDESSMARDFRKELAINPTEARQILVNLTPEQVIQDYTIPINSIY